MKLNDRLKNQLDQLNDRERRMVITAIIAVVIFVPYQIIWSPIVNTVAERKAAVQKKEKDLIWMKTRAPEVQRLSQSESAARTSGKPLYGLIESTARSRFGEGIRVQQEGKTGIRVQLQNASFDTLMNWLDNLQNQHQVYVKDFKIDSEKTVGRVRASILVEG